MNRHDLIFVSPIAWRSLLKSREELVQSPLVATWVDKGWPLMARRAMPAEGQGVPLGLPLPPFAGKKRLSFLMQPWDLLAITPPPGLQSAARVAPHSWRPTLLRLGRLASQQSMEARVFGSLAWRTVTGLDYLSDRSDLDFLLYVHRDANPHRLAGDLARIEADAPMRLDGEFIRSDGAAANWREFHEGSAEILVKSLRGVALVGQGHFVSGAVAL